RQGRASEAQIDVTINYFCLHPHVANNKLKGMLGKKELQGSWEELTNTLNAMFKNGKKKSVDSWKTTWRDTKTKVSNKVTSLKKNRAATGNKPNDIVLTERDKKIIDLIGHEYIEGCSGFFSRTVCKLAVHSFKRLIFDDVCVSSLFFNRKTYLSNWSKD
ncbi:hypothetical protein ALC57_11394, partial [Trachymyrmex cornetzi]